MRVDIVTPVWNAASTLRETLDSIHINQFGLSNHIIIDSNSNDGSSEIIAGYPSKSILHIREKDNGLYDGMNRGIKRCTAEIVGIINADDVLNESALVRVIEFFQNNSDMHYCFSAVSLIDSSSHAVGEMLPLSEQRRPRTLPFGFDERFYTPFPHPSLFVRKEVYLEIGCFDTNYRYSADHEFMLRLMGSRFKGARLPGALASFRLGGASSNTKKVLMEDRRIAMKYGMPSYLAAFNYYKCLLAETIR
jgi:glycosyltransferase involved in cell wall biosynthesis